MELNIQTVAYRNAPESLAENSRKALRESFPRINLRFVSDKADVIFFLSGGSEQEAIKAMQAGKYYLLLGGPGHNAWAAATEVKAWAGSKGISARLVSMEDAVNAQALNDFAAITTAFKRLQGKQTGLIGNVSHWLVASAFPLNLVKERFGINIRHLQWGNLPDYLGYPPDPEFLDTFRTKTDTTLENEARIYSFLQARIKEYDLSGLTLECFNMVNERNVTACLALAMLNSRGIAAGCEGDLVSLTGMMLVQALTGTIPWMANLAEIRTKSILFAHCTAPLNLLNDYKVLTHFETDKSAAVQGDINMEEVTVFRLNQNLDKAFAANGRIVSKPVNELFCRTQTEIEMAEADINKLRTRPLGNHHLIIPGNCKSLLKWACHYRQIKLV